MRRVFVSDREGTHRDEYPFTTDPSLRPAEVVGLYRGRWDIELLFKLWKSHNRLAAHREGAALEVMAMFYAKLLGWCFSTG